MDMMIDLPSVGEILVEEFMTPRGISAYRLAKDIFVPVSRVQDIIKGRRKVTVDTSIFRCLQHVFVSIDVLRCTTFLLKNVGKLLDKTE